MNETLDFARVRGIIRRRWKAFFSSFIIIIFISVFIAFILPPRYLSTSTILIENQMIPPEYVQTTITSFVEERLASITQQIMSRSRLMDIIRQFNLYEDLKNSYTTEEIVDKMRDNIHFEPKTSDVVDRRTGRSKEATIFFTLSYEGKDPSTVQRVANVLASLYLELNLKTRERLASNTTAFMENELERLKGQVSALDKKISGFKSEHMGELPEFNTVNLQTVQELNNQMDRLNMEISSLRDRKILLQGQLAEIDPLAPIRTAEGETVMNPTSRLKYLRMQLISLGSRFSENHPDYIRVKKEIDELEKHVEAPGIVKEGTKRLADLKAQLAEVKRTLGEDHPDVVRLKKEIKALSTEIEGAKASTAAPASQMEKPDNPAYINISTQIVSAENEIMGLEAQEKIIEKNIEAYRQKLANAPAVEQTYNELQMEIKTARSKYSEISSKLLEAQLAQGMETSQRGERFTIIDPAQLPEKPASPNRIAIVLIGFVLALGFGTGLAAVREALDNSVKSPEELMALTGTQTLSVIDLIETKEEKMARRKRKFVWATASIVIIGLFILLFHNYVTPLDVFTSRVEKKINRIQPM